MDKVIQDYNNHFIDFANSYVDNEKMQELFCIIPNMDYDVYKRTLQFYAQKKYEEFIAGDNGIPRNFYTVLENEMKNTSVLTAAKKYKFEIDLICDIMAIDQKEFIRLLNVINKNNKMPSSDALEYSQRLKDIIRKFNSYYKELFIKKVTANKMVDLNKTIVRNEKKSNDVAYERYIRMVLNDNELRKSISNVIFDKLQVDVTDSMLDDVLYAAFANNSVKEISDILGIKKPEGYSLTLAYKEFNRLRLNYEKLVNKNFKNYTLEEKRMIAAYINEKAIRKLNNDNLSRVVNDTFKALFNQSNIIFVEEIAVLMSKSQTTLYVNDNGTFTFLSLIKTTPNNKRLAKDYEYQMKMIKQIIRGLYTSYSSFNNYVKESVENSTPSSEADSYIDTRPWINEEKFKTLIDNIDSSKICKLTEPAFDQLQILLNEKGLLWAYYSNNIDISTITRIVNNFQSIYACVKNEDITINNLQDIIRKANLYDYADEFTIGLLGIDVVSKIINYNQFSGGKVTKEDIKKRVRKAIDLSYRAELINKSSLPYKVNVKNDNYSLIRYKNNDPSIFTSGVDTQTCFFLSVNENDFFYYSLLNKNGFIIKILNKDGKFIARATCFRKNNVLMINGIRMAGNKVLPSNREEFDCMKSIVSLIETMSKKIIETTTSDECPIDYVVCNKAGILENSYFDTKFAEVDTGMILEPINIYNDDWQEFIHTYDDQEEQMLQEVSVNPKTSFTTDFGHHYPAVMITSRDYKFIDKPSDVAYNDQSAIYERPRLDVEEYISEEIDEKVLARVNRIKALSCIKGNALEISDERKKYHLLKDGKNIKNLVLGEDWYILISFDNTYEIVYATGSAVSLFESKDYVNKIDYKFNVIKSDDGTYSLKLK